jgi:hypothetical protein
MQWYERSRDHWLEWSNKHSGGEWPSAIKNSWAIALVWSGNPDQARELAKLALHETESAKPYQWAMAA